MSDDEIAKMLDEYWGTDLDKLCAVYRGIIIHCSVNIESVIDDILIEYYFFGQKEPFPDLHQALAKMDEFSHTILSKEGMNLAMKASSLFFIINKYCKDFLNSRPVFIKDINAIIELRNDCAHRVLSTKLSDLEGRKIVLIYPTTERKSPKIRKIEITDLSIAEFKLRYLAVIHTLLEAKKEVRKIKSTH